MAYAPYTNDQVRPDNGLTLLLGQFREAECGHWFEYAIRPDNGTDFAPDLPHVVFVRDGFRYAKVQKTVAWVAVGENADGTPDLQRWGLKKHYNYDTAPYRQGQEA